MAPSSHDEGRDKRLAGVGERVKAHRLARGWSMRQLAERAGVSHNQINTVETGKISPLLDSVVRIAAALEVPLTELAYGEGDGGPAVPVPIVPASPGKRLDEMMQSLGRADRELAIALAEAVVEALANQRAEQASRRTRRRTG